MCVCSCVRLLKSVRVRVCANVVVCAFLRVYVCCVYVYACVLVCACVFLFELLCFLFSLRVCLCPRGGIFSCACM